MGLSNIYEVIILKSKRNKRVLIYSDVFNEYYTRRCYPHHQWSHYSHQYRHSLYKSSFHVLSISKIYLLKHVNLVTIDVIFNNILSIINSKINSHQLRTSINTSIQITYRNLFDLKIVSANGRISYIIYNISADSVTLLINL